MNYFALFILISLPFISSFRISPQDFAVNYLRQFGYLKRVQTRSPEETSDEQLTDAIKLFQSYFNLNLTGKLDNETLELMSRPRCGNPDILNDDDMLDMRSHHEKKKIFNGNFPSGKWTIRHITYRIANYQPNYAQNIPYKVNISGVIETRYYNVSYDLTHQRVREIIKRALDQWASVTELTFEEVSPNKEANIEFLFSYGQHGCGWSFDGPSNVLAHAFFPTSDQQGDVHFDYESWGEDPSQSVDLLVTTVHEFGHTLGLGHKEVIQNDLLINVDSYFFIIETFGSNDGTVL